MGVQDSKHATPLHSTSALGTDIHARNDVPSPGSVYF